MGDAADPKDAWAEALFDRVRPNWREEARASGERCRKNYQTLSAQTLEACRQEAVIINRSWGNRPW